MSGFITSVGSKEGGSGTIFIVSLNGKGFTEKVRNIFKEDREDRRVISLSDESQAIFQSIINNNEGGLIVTDDPAFAEFAMGVRPNSPVTLWERSFETM